MRTRAAPPAIAALLLAGSTWLTWWTASTEVGAGEVDLRASLSSVSVCDGDRCVSGLSLPTWSALGWITLIVLWLAAVAAGVLAQRRYAGADVTPFAPAVRLACRAAFVTTVVGVGWAMLSERAMPSFAPLLALAGVGLARYAAVADAFAISDDAVGPLPRAELRVARATASAELRFAVASASIEPDGLRAGDRVLAWKDVARVVARR